MVSENRICYDDDVSSMEDFEVTKLVAIVGENMYKMTV